MFELAKGDSEMSNRLLTTSPDVATSTNLTGFINRRWVPHQPSQPAAAKSQQPAVLQHLSLCNHPCASACMSTCSNFALPRRCSALLCFQGLRSRCGARRFQEQDSDVDGQVGHEAVRTARRARHRDSCIETIELMTTMMLNACDDARDSDLIGCCCVLPDGRLRTTCS